MHDHGRMEWGRKWISIRTPDRKEFTATFSDFSPPITSYIPKPGSLVAFRQEGGTARDIALILDNEESRKELQSLPRTYGTIGWNGFKTVVLTDEATQSTP